MAFETAGYLFTAFFIILGGAWFFLSATMPPPSRRQPIKTGQLLYLLGVFYILLAHVSMYAAVSEQFSTLDESPCENLVNSTVLNDTTMTTSYTYNNTCAARTPSEMAETLMVLFTWLVALGAIAVLITALFGAFHFLGRLI